MPLIGEAERVPCRWCEQEIVWAYDQDSRRRIPIDPGITVDGPLAQVIRRGRSSPGVRYLHGDEKISRQGARYWPHLKRCSERSRALDEIEVRRTFRGFPSIADAVTGYSRK